MLDVRFSRSLKAMLLLGHAEEEGSPVLSSAQLARSLDTNPSLVRKMMVPLVQNGLVASIKGRSGGVRLGRPSDKITLEEIYHSSIGDKPLWAPRPEGPRECLVTNHSAEYFVRLTNETEAAVLGALAGRTLADSLDELRVIDRADPPGWPIGASRSRLKASGFNAVPCLHGNDAGGPERALSRPR